MPSSKKTYKKTTVIIPLYNPNIGFLIESLGILANTQQDLIDRILLIDDGSPVPVGAHEKKLRKVWSRITIIRGLNRGPGGARNAGAQFAQTETIAFLDQDCRPSEHWLNNLLSPLNNSNFVAVMGKVSSLEDVTPVARYAEYIDLLKKPSLNSDGSYRCLVAANFAIKKKIFDALGGFDEHLTLAGEDLDLTYRLVQNGYDSHLSYIEDAVVFHSHRKNLAGFYKQQYGYGFGTVAHCLLRNRNPKEFGFTDQSFFDILSSLANGVQKSVLIASSTPYHQYGLINKFFVFPLLETIRTIARIIGHKDAWRSFPQIKRKQDEISVRHTVKLILRNKEEELLVMRKPDGGYGLVGGGIKKGESLEQALERECREELGINISDIDDLFYLGKDHAKLKINYHFETDVFSGLLKQQIIAKIKLSDEHESLAWLPPKKIPFPLSLMIEKSLAQKQTSQGS